MASKWIGVADPLFFRISDGGIQGSQKGWMLDYVPFISSV